MDLVCIRTREKGAVTPEETVPDLPVGVRESRVEVWVGGGLLQGWGDWVQQFMHGIFWGRSPLSSLPPPRYFREELKQRIWGKTYPRKTPWGPAVTSPFEWVLAIFLIDCKHNWKYFSSVSEPYNCSIYLFDQERDTSLCVYPYKSFPLFIKLLTKYNYSFYEYVYISLQIVIALILTW